jgi:class 3 adenylate cyclase
MTEVDLEALLTDIDDDVRVELASMPEVANKGDSLDIDALPIAARRWHKVNDAVAVVADLKNSTRLGLNKHQASTASIYEASTGGVVQIFDTFDADFVAIQGDGAFALFWGGDRDDRFARAICAGISIKTFSEKALVPRLEAKWDSLPETGLKVGIANSPLLVKRVGVPRSEHQEPVWAGRAVNYAAKAAQQADQHEMIVTGAVWDWVAGNDYLAATCDCGSGPSTDLWSDVTIDKIPDSDGDREGKLLTSSWCDIHGAEFCGHVLAGDKTRLDAAEVTKKAMESELTKTLRVLAKQRRRDRVARRQGGH